MSHDQRRNGDLAPGLLNKTEVAGIRPFRITERMIEDGCHEIEIEGELDLAVADRLEDVLGRCRGDRILISLRSCQFIDSTGIAVILSAHRERGSEIVLHSPCNQVLRILEITGLTADGFVFADREQALLAA